MDHREYLFASRETGYHDDVVRETTPNKDFFGGDYGELGLYMVEVRSSEGLGVVKKIIKQ